jgi:hypothetical protein
VITRAELTELQKHRAYPSVSILAATSRTAPANKQDRIRVKNLVTDAVDRLHREFKKREVAGVVKRLQDLVKSVDWKHTQDGLVLLASEGAAHKIDLPFKVKSRFSIDETFATRDLVHYLNRAPRYRVLVLSEKPTRVFDAHTKVLDEITAAKFPMEHIGPGGASKLPGGKGVNISGHRDQAHRTFFRSVDQELAKLQKADPLPLVVVGVERYLAFFQEVTSHADDIAGMLTGNHDKTSPSALGKLVWPVFQAGSTLRRTKALARLDEAVSASRHASGLSQVWRAVKEGKCLTLLVERDFAQAANLNETRDQLLPYSGKGPKALDDAVDDAIEHAMLRGAEVFFYEDGTLDLHDRIAAILRY